MKASLLLAALASPAFAANAPDLPACADVLAEKSHEQIMAREAQALEQKGQLHRSFVSEDSVRKAVSAQNDALYYFQRIREEICKRKEEDGAFVQAQALARTNAASAGSVDNCEWFGEQEKLFTELKRNLAKYKSFLEEKRKDWLRNLEGSFKFNRSVVSQLAKQKRIDAQSSRALMTETQKLWVGVPGPKGKTVPGYFPALSGFLLHEMKGVDSAVRELDGHRRVLRDQFRACGGMGLAGKADPELTRIAEDEAMRCRTPAQFVQKKTGLSEICGNRSKGKCYEATNATLVRAGYLKSGELAGTGAIQAHTDGYLERAGFRNVIDQGYTPTDAPEGAVLVYSSSHHPYGHIEVRTNGRNCSDYCLNGSPGPNYKLEAVYIRSKP